MKTWTRLLFGATALTSVAFGAPAFAASLDDTVNFQIAPGNLDDALMNYAKQTDLQVISASAAIRGKHTSGLEGAATPREALAMLLKDSGLSFVATGDNTVTVTSDPQSGSAAGDGAEGTVAALVVTAQKREENIQDVPIAISAFTEKTLQEQKIEGGFDLLKAIPNVTFSKNNFTSYNFSIRGIGTKAVSATTDPGVAVSFNNIALIQNRLFEQEYFDVERVEVLRGPQGTLYGRNATAGVINVISAKPNLQKFDGWLKGEVGNYHSKRLSAMVNIPLLQDKLGIRIAGALTDRQGYDYNAVTKNHVNGRDLWSGRVTIQFNPTEWIQSNLIWERFNEDDNRSRTGKQLCHRDNGLAKVGNTDVVLDPTNPMNSIMREAIFSTGCKAGSLYDPAAFGTPNGLALPFVFAMLALGGDCNPPDRSENCNTLFPLGYDRNGRAQTLVQIEDPYGGMMQSSDLRTIASFRDPIYRAKADVLELNVSFDLSDHLSLFSQTAYDKDRVYSFQDYNRFNTVPVFTDTSQLEAAPGVPSNWANLAPGGYFCDPQLGCSNTLAGFDISQAKADQFTQELRIQSHFDGPINFSAGANYTKFDVLVDYYVMYNLISAFALMAPFNGGFTNVGPDITKCAYGGFFAAVLGPIDINDPSAMCPYVDPNPVESINGEGHNYFRSKNPYKLKSSAAFSELYWQAAKNVKVTAGLRFTDDRKSFVLVPSQVLMAPGLIAGGYVNRGYPELATIKQHWGEWTGRLGIDWKPNVSFTDQTMVYAFYSRGYKGGGANPPLPGFATLDQLTQQALGAGFSQDFVNYFVQNDALPVLRLTGEEYKPTFRPEFANAFEVGVKNTLLGGGLTVNADAFYYDYKDYQVSQIRQRTAVNENFDATAWGLEFESMFAPTRNIQFLANLGYLDTSIADGMMSIDTTNRTQGDPDWVTVKPWAQLPSNCIVPVPVAENWLRDNPYIANYWNLCGGLGGLLGSHYLTPIDPATGQLYDPSVYNGQNGTVNIHGGAGIAANLGGRELPNAPHWTMNVGAQYGHDILDGSWRAAVRADAYWQSQSWARVYNAVNDKLHGWYNVNLSVWLEKPDQDLKIEFYAKNLLDKSPITDAFLNSDDTALTTNVFVLDPRLIGLSIKKGF